MVTLSQSIPSSRIQPTGSRHLLVVEDEDEIRQLIVLHLRREGFQVTEAADGDQARQLLLKNNFDLVVLDWMMPHVSGLELTQWIRGQSQIERMPILFVTAKTEPEDVVEGLNAGADDYLPKPFDTMVLMARVNALLRRQEWLSDEPTQSNLTSAHAKVTLGDLVLNMESYEVTLKGRPLELTRSEFRLLETLMLNQGKVCSRESLIERIQGEGVNVIGRTVDTHVFGLRKKMEEYADVIETIRGVGYRVRYLPVQ